MAKSNYGQIKKYENEILAMKEAGYKTQNCGRIGFNKRTDQRAFETTPS